jgi:hypothetical protein
MEASWSGDSGSTGFRTTVNVGGRKVAKNWIAGAIKHPGVERKAAKKAGMSTQGYMQAHKHDSGKAGARARLGITLTSMHKKSAHGSGVMSQKDMEQGHKKMSSAASRDTNHTCSVAEEKSEGE